MASFVEDIARLREVLQANAVDKIVDEDILFALLELYASDNQRVDMVVLDLEGMLGKELSVGAQQQRWDELQKPANNTGGILINYENIHQVNNNGAEVMVLPQVTANPAGEVIVLDNVNNASTSRQTGFQSTNRNKRHLSGVSIQSSRTKRKTPNKEDLSRGASYTNLQQEKSAQVTGVGSSSNNVTKLAVGSSSRIPDAQTTNNATYEQPIVEPTSRRTYHDPTQTVPSTSTASSTTAISDGHVRIEEELNNILQDDTKQPVSKENMEARAMAFHKEILNTITDVNVKYAAHKATEYTMLHKSTRQLEEYLSEAIMDPKLPRVGTFWDQLPVEPEHQRLCLYVYNQFLNDQVDFIALAIPDADPEFLEAKVKHFQGDQELIRNFVTEMLEGKETYPTRAEYNRRKEHNELVNKFFTVEEFFELYDDPLKHFRDDTRITDLAYRDEALNQLKMDFRFTSVNQIRRVFADKNHHYTPAFLALQAAPMVCQRKTKRGANECYGMEKKDVFLLQEVAFVGRLQDIEVYQQNKEQMRLDAVAHCRANGTLLDCPICCEDELIDTDLIYCPMGHGICKICVRRQTEELIGLMKNHVPCLSPDCSAEYTVNDLKMVLNKSTFYRFEKRRQAEEVLAAGIEGLESCPFCDYCEVPPEAERIFRCQNPDCSKVSCRQCREVNHAPLRCEEVAMKQRLHNYVETKMTEALMRQCPACKRNFVKADGCNKMVCVCGAIMCYVCRKQIKDYNHFSNQNMPNQPVPAGQVKCPLYCDTEKMHEAEVARSAAVARAELASSNPNLRVDLILGKK